MTEKACFLHDKINVHWTLKDLEYLFRNFIICPDCMRMIEKKNGFQVFREPGED